MPLSQKSGKTQWIPLLIIGGSFLFAVSLIFGLKAEKKFRLAQSVALKAEDIREEIEKDVQQLIHSLEKFAGHIDADKGISETTWTANTAHLLQEVKGLIAIDWLDPGFLIQKSAPDAASNASVQFHAPLEKLLPRRELFITAAPQTPTDPLRLLFFYPNYWDQTLQGFLAYTIDVPVFSKYRLLPLLGDRYALKLSLGDSTLSILNDTALQDVEEWKAETTAAFSNFAIGISVYPSAHFLKEYYSDNLLHLSLIGGLLLLFCFALLIYLWHLAKHRTAPSDPTRYQAFVASSDVWMWEMDTQRILTYSNSGIKKILGFTPEEVIGKDLLSLIPKKEQPTFLDELNRCIQQKTGWRERQVKWRAKKGKERHLTGHAEPLLDAKGALIGFRGVDTDVTDRVLAEESLSEFISIASHELKTPLTSIHGAIGLALQQENLTEKTQDLLKIAARNSDRLTALVTDLLDTKKLQGGLLTSPLKPVSVKSILSEALLSSKPAAEKAHVTLIEEGPIPDSSVNADPSRLLQVMMNLMSNAIKFSPPQGNVFLSCQILHDKVRVSVRDQGKGIPEEYQDKIFHKFPQETPLEETFGAGLGLFISKNIIEQCLGTIDFTTKKDAGTTFYFELPILKKE